MSVNILTKELIDILKNAITKHTLINKIKKSNIKLKKWITEGIVNSIVV